MNISKSINGVARGCLILLVIVFSGTFVPSSLAGDTVEVDMSLQSYAEITSPPAFYQVETAPTGNYMEGDSVGFCIAIEGVEALEAIKSDGAVSNSCQLLKGMDYTVSISKLTYDEYEGGYNADITPASWIIIADTSFLGDHSTSDFTDTSTTNIGSTTIYVPKFELDEKNVIGALLDDSGDYIIISSNVTLELTCTPEDCVQYLAAEDITWEGGTVSDVLKRNVVISGTNTGETVTATYGDEDAEEEILNVTFLDRYGFTSGNPDYEGRDEFVKAHQDSKEPIDTKTGNNHFLEQRLFTPSQGIPLELDLAYKSVTSQPTGRLGNGWRHSYEWFLDVPTNNPPILYTGTGDKFIFGKKADGTYISPLANNWTLEASGTGHDVMLPAGVIYHFESAGQLASIRDSWGVGVDCSYNASNCLVSVTHDNGRSITFSNNWDTVLSEWRVTFIQMQNGASLAFDYNDDGQFTQVVEQVESDIYTSTYQYADGYLTNKVNGAGFEYSFGYESGTGKGTHLSVDSYYDHDVDYNGDDTDVTYHTRGLDQIHRYAYLGTGVLDAKYGPAATTQDVTQRGTSYSYAPNRTDIIEETLFDNNEDASWSEFMQYDDAHNVTNLSVAYGTTNPVHQLSLEYDVTLNLPTAMIEPDGSRIEITYTNGLPQIGKAFYSDTQSHDTHYSYSANGLLQSITNANDHAVAYTYDTSGNLSTITPEVGPVVTNTYDALGFLKTTEFYIEEGMIAPSRRITEYGRDAKGRVTQVDYPDGLTSSYAYNALGYLTNSVDRAGRATDYTYAPTKKLTSVTQYLEQGGSNVPVRVAYDLDEQVNVLRITEPRGRYVESYQLDIQDRVTSVTNIESQVMSIDYGVGNFVKEITRFDDSTITNGYDTAGRKTSVTYNAGGASPLTISYDYYADSLLKSIDDGTSTNQYGYNRLNRLTTTTNVINSLTLVADYQYDPVGNVTNTSVSIGTEVVSSSYTYDAAERLYSMARPVPESTTNSTFVYAYNPRNGAVSSVYNNVDGIRCSYGYDIMERVDAITYSKSDGSLIRSIGYIYDDAGMITNKTIAGGVDSLTLTYDYDSINRLTGETRSASGSTSQTTEYNYDLAGNRLTKTANDNSVSYALGTGNRLASWSASFTNNLVADVRGTSSETIGTDDRWGTLWVSNLTAQVGTKPQVDGTSFLANNIAMQMGTNEFVAAIRDEAGNMGYATNTVVYSVVTNATFLYNTAGCVTNIAHTGTGGYSDSLELGWDERYRLTSANDGTTEIEYGYDVQNRKVSRTVGSTTEYYVYDGNQVVADVDSSGNLLRSYVWGMGIDNLMSFTDHSTSNTYYPIKDHQNTVIALVDENGVVVESYDYDAYGRTKVFSASGAELSASAYGNRYAFQGREVEWTTGLYYFRARWYSPEVGRWLSKDPIGIAGGMNLYEFCGSNPVNFVDPFGLTDIEWISTPDFNHAENGDANTTTFGAHGAPDGNSVQTPGGYFIDGTAVGNSIAHQVPDNKTLVLYVCNAANGEVAQDVANRTGNTVVAPNGYVTSNGDIWTSKADRDAGKPPDGKWETFYPKTE